MTHCKAEEDVARIRDLHPRSQCGTCTHCSENAYPDYAVPWPCPTIAAIESISEHCSTDR